MVMPTLIFLQDAEVSIETECSRNGGKIQIRSYMRHMGYNVVIDRDGELTYLETSRYYTGKDPELEIVASRAELFNIINNHIEKHGKAELMTDGSHELMTCEDFVSPYYLDSLAIEDECRKLKLMNAAMQCNSDAVTVKKLFSMLSLSMYVESALLRSFDPDGRKSSRLNISTTCKVYGTRKEPVYIRVFNKEECTDILRTPLSTKVSINNEVCKTPEMQLDYFYAEFTNQLNEILISARESGHEVYLDGSCLNSPITNTILSDK